MNGFPSFRSAGLARAVLYGVLLAGLYHSAFHWLVTMDWPREDYSSCALVPPIVLYLLWEKRRVLAGLPSIPTWKGFVPLALGIALYWLGELSGEYFSLYLSSWLVLVGLCWMHLGWRKLSAISFPLAFFLAAFPLPLFLNTKLSLHLKLLSSRLGVWTLQACGLSAYREGNVIDLGFTRLQVVDACSGIRFLVPLITMGVLLAYYYRAALWKKALLVLSTIPLSVLTNGLRIAAVGILYQYWGPRVAEGFFHNFSGWFIFMITLGLLLAEMWAMKMVFPERVRGSASGGPPVAPMRATGLSDAAGPPQGWLPPPQAIVAVLLLGATLALTQGVNFREKTPVRRSLDQFPLRLGEWEGVSSRLDQAYLDALHLTDHTVIHYRNRDNKEINFYTAYYDSQSKGRSVHTPETCLPGSGWHYEESGLVTIPRGGAAGGPMRVNRAFMYKGGDRELTYYWFPQRGRILTSLVELKLYVLWDALLRQRTDGALVRLITPVYEKERLEDAEARLQAFTREIAPALSRFIPE